MVLFILNKILHKCEFVHDLNLVYNFGSISREIQPNVLQFIDPYSYLFKNCFNGFVYFQQFCNDILRLLELVCGQIHYFSKLIKKLMTY